MASRKGAPQPKFQPILEGDEEGSAASIATLLEAKTQDKIPVLYPPRNIKPPLKPSPEDRKLMESAKKISDKMRYSGFYQSTAPPTEIHRFKDKFRLMIGVRTVSDELDHASKAFLPPELRKYITEPKHRSEVRVSSVTLATLSSLMSDPSTNKRRRLENGEYVGGDGDAENEDLANVAASAHVPDNYDDSQERLEESKARKENKQLDKKLEKQEDDSEEEEDEDDDEEADEDDEYDDDFGENSDDDGGGDDDGGDGGVID